jgi:hypothetical protein
MKVVLIIFKGLENLGGSHIFLKGEIEFIVNPVGIAFFEEVKE